MARIKLVYLGGGSTRAAGTMASLIANGADFEGSEVVLVDLDEDRLALIRTLAEKMARARGHDITVTATTDRRAALPDCDAVLSSFRPGGFEARVSMSYRDSYLRIVPGLNGQDADGMDSGTYIDASASYWLNDHVQFTLEGQNLGDTYEHTFNDSVAQRNEYYRNFGRQYTLGVRFNY